MKRFNISFQMYKYHNDFYVIGLIPSLTFSREDNHYYFTFYWIVFEMTISYKRKVNG